MRPVMRNLVILAALCAALPLAAQDNKPVAPTPQDQEKPQSPALEKPGTAAPEPAKEAAKESAKKPAPTVGVNAKVVEEIVARVNNEIITRSELDKARVSAEEDAKQECEGKCTPEQLRIATEDRQKNALRDLIDQSLLAQRGKDMGVNVETEVIKKLDQIRVQNKLASMEELESAVSSQGLNWEDVKDNIRKGFLTQRVISSEVGSHITIGREEIEKYYNEHKAEFVRAEQVALRSIEVNTEKKSPEEIVERTKKAETTLKRIKDGEDFGEMAKRFSDGSTAKQGGFLGVYKRGELSKELEDAVFKMRKNDVTDVMDTKQGFLILQVLEHYDEGEQSLAKVEPKITDKLYSARMEPALREYVKTLR